MSLRNIQQYFQEYILTHEDENINTEIKGYPEAYADAYEARLLEAMEKTFPLLYKKLGEDKFDELCIAYLIEHPSTHFSLSQIGEKFAQYAKDETAELDWAIHKALDAANSSVLTQDILQQIPEDKWSGILFELHPSFSLLSNYRVWRKGIQIFYLPINQTEYIFLKSIQDKLSFGEICEKLSGSLSEDEVVNFAITHILKYLSDELITGVNFTDELA